MRLTTRATAYILTGMAAITLGGGLATAAFADTDPPAPATDQIVTQPDGTMVLTPTLPFVVEENTPVERRADGTLLIPDGTPVEVLPNGAVRIG